MSIGNAIIASRLKVGYMDDYFFIEIGPDPDTFKMIKCRRLMTNAAEVLHSLRFTNRCLHCDSLTLTWGGE